MRVAATHALVVGFLAAACVPGVDLSQLHPADGTDAVDADGDVEAIVDIDADLDIEPDLGVDAADDADNSSDSGAEADPAGDVDGDGGVETDADSGADADGDADGDVGADADADADGEADVADITVGPPSRVWGELTTSGSAAGAGGCAAHATGYCLRSDSVDSTAQEMSGGGFRLRGIVVGGGAR